jgi:hypothetical protein
MLAKGENIAPDSEAVFVHCFQVDATARWRMSKQDSVVAIL